MYTPRDHEGFVACINDFYRGGYPYPKYLRKDRLEELIREGKLIITLAKTPEGRVVGTSAARLLTGAFEGSVLLLLRCVVSDMQRKGIGSRQEEFLLGKIREHFPDALSLYADVMTHDAASQKTMLKKGFTLCGLRLMMYKNEQIVPGLSFPPGTKMTQAVYCRKNTDRVPELQVPREHRDFIEGIYRDMGLSVRFSPEKPSLCRGRWTVKDTADHRCAEIHILENPRDPSELVSAIRELLSRDYTCVCYLPMSKDGSADLYGVLVREGFRFSGIKPLSATGEYMILCHCENAVKDFGLIALPEDKQAFLSYITENGDN